MKTTRTSSAAIKARAMSRSFAAQEGEAAEAFLEDGLWSVVTSDGHTWCHDGAEWVRFTDDDDWYVQELAA